MRYIVRGVRKAHYQSLIPGKPNVVQDQEVWTSPYSNEDIQSELATSFNVMQTFQQIAQYVLERQCGALDQFHQIDVFQVSDDPVLRIL